MDARRPGLRSCIGTVAFPEIWSAEDLSLLTNNKLSLKTFALSFISMNDNEKC